MIDRHQTAALPFSGSSLLSKYYPQVPLLSIAWGIGQIQAPLNRGGGIRVFGLQIPVPTDTMVIGSLSWVGHIHLRIEEIAPTEATAADTAESVQTILRLARAAQDSAAPGPLDQPMRSMLNSIKMERHSNKAVLTGTIPTPLLQHLLDAPQDIHDLPTPGSDQPH
jgi:hypothetical protein